MDHSDMRRFKRYDVSVGDVLIGRVLGEEAQALSLVSVSQGGCSFFTETLSSEWSPPRQLTFRFIKEESFGFCNTYDVKGEVIYVRPINSSLGLRYQIGVRFLEDDRVDIQSLMGHLEELAQSGYLSRI